MDSLPLPTSPAESLTLLDLQRMVRATLEGRFREPLWISAEISELKVNRSGHCYINLVEKGENDGAPRAEARAVIWRSTYTPLVSMFEAMTGASLSAGIRILARVVVTYHEIYGFSLQIIDLDPRYTLGEVERRRRETISRLQSDGVWDMNRELTPPRPTLRIAIVSSATAAGYQDFMCELQRTPYRFRTTLFESLMQGDMAEESVIMALKRIAEREEEFDVVAIIRGGGSTSDLALFDSYLIASYVAQFPLPIFAGIGHDKDVSIVDMVAHTTCKTPTAVATLLTEMVDAEMNILDDFAADIKMIAERRITDETMRLYRHQSDIERIASETIQRHSHTLDMLQTNIYTEAKTTISSELQRIDKAQHIIDGYSVDNILRLGFAVLHGKERVITSIATVATGDAIDITLKDGVLKATITEIKPKR